MTRFPAAVLAVPTKALMSIVPIGNGGKELANVTPLAVALKVMSAKGRDLPASRQI